MRSSNPRAFRRVHNSPKSMFASEAARSTVSRTFSHLATRRGYTPRLILSTSDHVEALLPAALGRRSARALARDLFSRCGKYPARSHDEDRCLGKVRRLPRHHIRGSGSAYDCRRSRNMDTMSWLPMESPHANAVSAFWGIPRSELFPAVLITAYRPYPECWADDSSRRTK